MFEIEVFFVDACVEYDNLDPLAETKSLWARQRNVSDIVDRHLQTCNEFLCPAYVLVFLGDLGDKRVRSAVHCRVIAEKTYPGIVGTCSSKKSSSSSTGSRA